MKNKSKYLPGDYVFCTPRTKDCLAKNEFIGIVEAVKCNSGGGIFYIIRDQNDNCFDMEDIEIDLMKD